MRGGHRLRAVADRRQRAQLPPALQRRHPALGGVSYRLDERFSFDVGYSFVSVEDMDIRAADAGGPDANGPFSGRADTHVHYVAAAIKMEAVRSAAHQSRHPSAVRPCHLHPLLTRASLVARRHSQWILDPRSPGQNPGLQILLSGPGPMLRSCHALANPVGPRAPGAPVQAFPRRRGAGWRRRGDRALPQPGPHARSRRAGRARLGLQGRAIPPGRCP